jgi:hypothetical protein
MVVFEYAPAAFAAPVWLAMGTARASAPGAR